MIESEEQATYVSSEAVQLATESWGWITPPESILRAAELSIQLQNLMVGEAVVKLGLMPEDKKNALLKSKPADRQTLDWLSTHEPQVKAAFDKIMALRDGIQYFDDLHNLGIVVHPDMKKLNLRRYCEEKRCVLGLMEQTKPVLCFGKWEDLERYRMAGRAERNEVKNIAPNHALAVGNPQRVTEWVAAAGSASTELDETAQKNLWLPTDTRDSEALRKFATLIDVAMSMASDIDINPLRSGQGRVMLRVNTKMQDPPGGPYLLSPEELTEVTRFIAKKCGANTTGARILKPCDGQLIYRSSAGEIFIRVSVIPLDPGGTSYDMLSVDLRLHKRREVAISLHSLNMQPDVIESCRKAAAYSQGLILFIGPTNTGKSTSIAGLIGLHVDLFGDSRKRISIEHPVERFVPGIKQISVPSKDLFAPYFESILRHDPDLVMIGEIRDQQTANTAVDAGLSGHLVVSTLHANDPIIGIRRLANMIQEDKRFDLYEAATLLVSQRLAMTLCDKCYQGAMRKPTEQEIDKFNEYAADNGITIKMPDGIPKLSDERHECDVCRGNGYNGVMPIFEVLPVTRTVKDLLAIGKFDYQNLGKHRTRTLVGSAMELVALGKTTLDSVFI